MTTIAQAQRGIANFIDREVIPSLSVMERIVVGTGAGLITARLPEVIKIYANHPLMQAMNVVDVQNGEIDIQAIYDSAIPYIGADQIPVKIPLVGITLKMGKREFETLYKYIMEA
jgi:hypothetical protein